MEADAAAKWKRSVWSPQGRFTRAIAAYFVFLAIMVVIGGLGSLPGAALGAVIVVLAPELLRSSGELRLILFGFLVIVLMGTGNRGLAGLIVDLFARVRGSWQRRTSAKAAAPGV